jgi:hypothetical protein
MANRESKDCTDVELDQQWTTLSPKKAEPCEFRMRRYTFQSIRNAVLVANMCPTTVDLDPSQDQ